MACGTFVWSIPKGLAVVRLALAVACLGMTVTTVAMASGFDQSVSTARQSADATLAFDISPQPLMTALRAYSEVTGQAVLVDASLLAGRLSPGVTGQFNKVDALQKLLAGTGLIASYSTDQAFTLKLAEHAESTDVVASKPSDSSANEDIEAVTERYAGRIQRPIEAALCRSDLTRPGTYRLALQLWIAPSGKVERTHMLSANDGDRTKDVLQALDNLVLEPPTDAMPQPLTLLFLPRKAADVRGCGAPAPHRS